MLTSILSHFGFANCIVDFFSNYLVGRSTQYSWNSFLSGACDADVGVGQGSALSPILSALYIAPLIRKSAMDCDRAPCNKLMNKKKKKKGEPV